MGAFTPRWSPGDQGTRESAHPTPGLGVQEWRVGRPHLRRFREEGVSGCQNLYKGAVTVGN